MGKVTDARKLGLRNMVSGMNPWQLSFVFGTISVQFEYVFECLPHQKENHFPFIDLFGFKEIQTPNQKRIRML